MPDSRQQERASFLSSSRYFSTNLRGHNTRRCRQLALPSYTADIETHLKVETGGLSVEADWKSVSYLSSNKLVLVPDRLQAPFEYLRHVHHSLVLVHLPSYLPSQLSSPPASLISASPAPPQASSQSRLLCLALEPVPPLSTCRKTSPPCPASRPALRLGRT